MPPVPVVAAAFAPKGPSHASPQTPRPLVGKGLELVFHTRFESGLYAAVARASGGPLLAAATVDGGVSFVDDAGRVVARADDLDDDPPNVMAFVSQWLVLCGDDGCVRCLAVDSGEIMHTHAVAEPPKEGRRPRCLPIDHAVVLGDTAYVAAAGRLLHACRVPDGRLEHSVAIPSPVRAMCAAPASAGSWAYAYACADGLRLVSRAGETVREFRTERTVRSLGAAGPWVGAGTMEGTVELWDVVNPRPAEFEARRREDVAHVTLQTNAGSDGTALDWRADGGAVAVGGKRSVCYDFTGANPPHPYRKAPARVGQPDGVPRVCMADGATLGVAWAPRHSEGAPSLATVDKESGVLRLWNPHGLPLRKGGSGDPAQPQRMKPQFYTFSHHSAPHPSGEGARPCALMWLREGVAAVGYFSGEVVAWRVAGQAS